MTPALLHRVNLQPGTAQEVIGLRLANRCPVCVTDAVDEVSSAVQPQNVLQSVSWQQVSQAMAADGWLLGEFLGLFGLIALVAAACALANVTAARAVAQRQSTAMLKAIGFTPGQVAGASSARTCCSPSPARALAPSLPGRCRGPRPPSRTPLAAPRSRSPRCPRG